MVVDFIVGLAAILQYVAAILALRVLRITGRELAWLLISAVVFLQAIRRSVVLYHSLLQDAAHPPDLAGECVGLAISIVMLIGVARIGPYFLSILESKEELRKRSYDLGERVKELDCLYKMAGLTEQPNVSLEQIVRGTVDLIPSACRYPQRTCARVVLKDNVFETIGFQETPWKLDHEIVVRGERFGALEVCCRGENLEDDELFSKEERNLIHAIAWKLGRIVERMWAEEDREALQEQLHQASKMEAVGQLGAGVAHEFSNLLTVIRGHTDRASAMLPDEKRVRKELEFIQEAADEATDLTRSLLTFSRKLPSKKKPIDLCVVVQESERLLRRTLPAAIEIVVDAACESPLLVNADRTRIRQVILNLAINARDAMPDGGILHVSLSPMVDTDVCDLPEASGSGGLSARLVVADTGVGMSQEVQARIFEPFFTTRTRGQGTGLGLSIVHGIVQDHGGRIEVRSELGAGTTFTVMLPCIRSGEVADHVASESIKSKGNGELILLAEDDQHVRGIIASTLESLGYEVILAKDGPTVLVIFSHYANDIRLFILDADLPGRSGSDCLRELRNLEVKAPAIVITGNVGFDSSQLDDKTVLLRKPFGMPELARTVSEALGSDIEQETRS